MPTVVGRINVAHKRLCLSQRLNCFVALWTNDRSSRWNIQFQCVPDWWSLSGCNDAASQFIWLWRLRVKRCKNCDRSAKVDRLDSFGNSYNRRDSRDVYLWLDDFSARILARSDFNRIADFEDSFDKASAKIPPLIFARLSAPWLVDIELRANKHHRHIIWISFWVGIYFSTRSTR